MAAEVLRWLDNPARRSDLRRRFNELHENLRCGASRQAAAAVAGLLRHEDG
jgi:lipid A disaccharide synthetase